MAYIQRYEMQNGRKRYRVRYRTAAGKLRSKSFPRSHDARRFLATVESRLALGELYEAERETFGQFLEGWLQRYRHRVRESTYDRTTQVLKHLEAFRETPLDRITPAEVEDYFIGLARSSPRQAQIGLQTVKKVLENARARGHAVNPAVFAIRPPRTEFREMRFLTWSEVEELASNTIEPYGNLVQLAALTGLRQGELFALRDTAIDFEAGAVAVTHTIYKGQLVPPKTTAAQRRVDLSAHAQRILRAQLLARVPNALGLVFPTPTGKVLHDDNFRHRVFGPACRRSGLAGLRFHDLRHTYAALMVRAGAQPKYLQAQMGHTDIRTTLDTYGHLYPDANRAVLGVLDALTRPDGAIDAPSAEAAQAT